MSIQHNTPFEKEKKFAISTAQEAGAILLKHYRKTQAITWKSRTDFKSQVDDASEKLIRARIKDRFPQHNVYGEEQEDTNTGSSYSWVIDPLDGTIPYTRKTSDHFAVSIGLTERKKPVLGVVYLPLREELFFAEIEQGAYCNDRPIKVSLEENVNHVVIGGPDGGKETASFQRTRIISFIEKLYAENGIQIGLGFGSGASSMCLTARGNLDAYLALSLEPYDMVGAVPIMREAGALVTNLKGREWTLDDPSILAANPTLHEKLLTMVQGLYIPES